MRKSEEATKGEIEKEGVDTTESEVRELRKIVLTNRKSYF